MTKLISISSISVLPNTSPPAFLAVGDGCFWKGTMSDRTDIVTWVDHEGQIHDRKGLGNRPQPGRLRMALLNLLVDLE